MKLFETTTSIAVFISLVVTAIILSVSAAIGGSYLLTLQAIHTQKVQAAALAVREKESSVRTAIPTCKALIQMDDAKNGASNASQDPNSYGHRLAAAITTVVDDTGCRKLVYQVEHGVPILKIAEEKK
jgi:hypothetical protein